jgi:cardiolipin synthase C
VLALTGCASQPQLGERTASKAFDRPEETSLGRSVAQRAARQPGLSGFAVVRDGRDAFTARIGLADLAERSLDLQYYIWESDTTGRILATKLVGAAERGVRVRLLLDDNGLADRDFGFAILDGHPNIEIRVFNPFTHRSLHALDFATSFDRLNQRMHNKVMIADGAVAVVGGRNIGDHYFGVNPQANFRDLDVVAVGPVVRDIGHTFDMYWNSQWAFPIASLHDDAHTAEDVAKLRVDVARTLAAHPYPYPLEEDVNQLRHRVDQVSDGLVWAHGRVVADDPGTLDAGGSLVVRSTLVDWLQSTQRELLIESAYFVMRAPSVAGLSAAVDRGVRIRVLTNSLASNDVAAAHAGHEEFRPSLLRAGVELYELRPDASRVRQEWTVTGGRSIAALHTKAIVVDRESTFVGSFNLDPRSGTLNTEVGLIIDSPELAGQVAAFMDQGVQPDNAYRVTLDPEGRVRWTTIVDGKWRTFDREPETSVWKRLAADIVRLLPLESQL